MKFKLIILLIGSIFLGGCASSKIQSSSLENAIYKTDYKVIEGQVITLKELTKELGKEGVQLSEYDMGEERFFEEYYFEVDNMNVDVSTKGELENGDDQVLQGIQIRPGRDDLGDTLLHENSFLKSLLKLMKEEQISAWIEDLESQYHGLAKQDDFSDQDEIADIKIIGRTVISFVGSPRRDYKLLEITWGSWKDIPKELEGVGAELEHQGLVVVDYANGFKGNMIKVESGPYHLIQSNRINTLGENPVDTNHLVAYKVMYDPASENHYSTQLYGLIPDDSKDEVAIEDMVGIDAISRVLGMSWDDFNDVTDVINQELIKLKESLEQGRRGEYNGKGQVSGYSYEIYGEGYMGFYRFTVLLEKI